MFINPNEQDDRITHVHGLSPLEKALVRSYLQGCVYSWCKNKTSIANDGTKVSEPFKAQYFLGGDNYYWQGTPLYSLYAKRLRYYEDDSEKAVEQAARDAGHLLKELLAGDKRRYHTWTVSGYRWYQWDAVDDEQLIEDYPLYHDYVTRAKRSLEPSEDSFVEVE